MRSRKVAGFFIFVGLLLIGAFFYKKYVGEIPIIDNLINSVVVSDVIGPRLI